MGKIFSSEVRSVSMQFPLRIPVFALVSVTLGLLWLMVPSRPVKRHQASLATEVIKVGPEQPSREVVTSPLLCDPATPATTCAA